ncbi:ABC transporter substrate-binding protein [Streptomyces zaomyceticus]|uniref:ABC transporter substrate-binding protein n=1 Tax=Streptomyces zaomyceticus TaxID=68286 RepID=UPI0036A413F6
MRRSTRKRRCDGRNVRSGLVVTVLIAICAAGSAAPRLRTGQEGERGEISLVTGRDLTGYLQNVLDEWNRRHPAEKVTLTELPEAADDVHAQLVESLASGSSQFDVLNIDVAWTAEFAHHQWIAPLNASELPVEQLFPSVRETAVYDNRLYAMPYVTNAGLLYYRRDVLAAEGLAPPRTWQELERQALEIAPAHGLDGYAAQLQPYEGLAVNVTEAVQSEGGRVLDPEGTRVLVDSAAGLRAFDRLRGGIRKGWIPRAALDYKEEESRQAFQSGRLLFMRNWPYAYAQASAPGSAVAGKIGIAPLPGIDGQGVGVLGGSNLAVNANSRHPRTAADLLAYLTSERVQRRVLTEGALPPVWASLYRDPELIRRFPYLPVLENSVRSAMARPRSPVYDQVSLAIAAVAHAALLDRGTSVQALARLRRELEDILRSRESR